MCLFEHPILLNYFILVYLFIGGWWREDFAWWRVRWWRDRSLVASSLVASLPAGEVTGNHLYTLFWYSLRQQSLVIVLHPSFGSFSQMLAISF